MPWAHWAAREQGPASLFMFPPNLHTSVPHRKTTLGLGEEAQPSIRKPNLHRNGYLKAAAGSICQIIYFPTYSFPYGTMKYISFKIAS